MSAFHEITGLKSRLQTSVLCQGLRAVFMSACHFLTETWKVSSEGELVRCHYSHWYSDEALRLNNTHTIHLSLLYAFTDVH